MKRTQNTLALFAGLTLLSCTMTAFASEAETSAGATSGRRGQSGTANGTARYSGDLGFARTDSRTGAINAARSVAVGVDQDGLSLSVSTAVAPRRGTAVATNFNMSIGTRGDVALSTGSAHATGGRQRGVSVVGNTRTTRHDAGATSVAQGKTSRGGTTRVATRSEHHRVRRVTVQRHTRHIRRTIRVR